MAEAKTPKTSAPKSRSTPNRKADTSQLSRTGRTVKQRPYVSAAIATGAVTAVAAAAAAGAFFFSRRDKSFGEFTSRVKDGFAEASDKFLDRFAKDKPQSDIAVEALTLKETGKFATSPVDDLAGEKIKAGSVAH